jgi:TonB family protein
MNLFRIAAAAFLLAPAGVAQNGTQSTQASAAAGDSNEKLYQSFQMGVLAIQDRQWNDAVTSLNEAVRLDPTQGAAWTRLGEAYFGLARSKRGPESTAALRKAVDAYSKAVEKNPDDAAAHNGYALALAGTGRFEELVPEMEKAAALDPPKAAQYYYSFGDILLNAGHAEAAAGALRKAAQAAPGIAQIYFPLASALCSEGRIVDGKASLPAEALEALRDYLKAAPTGPYSGVVKEAIAFEGSTVPTSFGEPLVEKPGAPRAIPVGAKAQEAKLTSKPSPAYPPLARRLRISGTVRMNVLIGENGAVMGASVDSGNPWLAGAALDAVKLSVYKPTLLNDKPVRVRTAVDVVFALSR